MDGLVTVPQMPNVHKFPDSIASLIFDLYIYWIVQQRSCWHDGFSLFTVQYLVLLSTYVEQWVRNLPQSYATGDAYVWL